MKNTMFQATSRCQSFLGHRCILQRVSLLVLSVFIASVVTILLYKIPIDRISENVRESAQMYGVGKYKIDNWANGKLYAAISNFTDSLMINTAIFRPTDSAVHNAMMTAHAEYPNEEMTENLVLIANNESGYSVASYSRYWHGYLLYMIPALSLMDVGELKNVSMIIQFALTVYLLYLLSRHDSKIAIYYIFIILFFNPITTALTFQEADIYIITTCFMIAIARHSNRDASFYSVLFFLDGICVAFFDLLTYPLVSLGLPLILLLYAKKPSVRFGIVSSAIFSADWVIGYAGMWAGKWVAASLLTGTNQLSDAISQIGTRTYGLAENGAELTYENTIKVIMESVNCTSMRLLALLFVIITLLFFFTNRHSALAVRLHCCFPVLFVGCYPFVWYLVAMNHSLVHPWMSYRELAITIWAVAVAFVTLMRCSDSIPSQDDESFQTHNQIDGCKGIDCGN